MAILEPFILRSFAGGELSPAMAARADLAKFTIGVKTCRNFEVQRHGGLANRAGFRFCGTIKNPTSGNVRIFPYRSEVSSASALIEAGQNYLRFWLNGGQVGLTLGDLPAWSGAATYQIGDLVTSGGVAYYAKVAHSNEAPPDAGFWHPQPDGIYEVPTAFSSVIELQMTQSGRVLTFTHPDYPPADVVYQSIIGWAYVPLDTKPKVVPPTNLVVTGAAGARQFAYVVTAAAAGSYEESEASNIIVDAAIAEPTAAAPHALAWDVVLTPPVTGDPSPEYYVYCDPHGNGTFGFIGTATGAATFNNPGLTPDFSQTPPLPRELFTSANEYPATCAYYQQRRILGFTRNVPDGIYGSRVGFPDNFGISSPLRDDDAITFRIAGNDGHAVRRLLGLKRLIAMTDAGEWAIGRELEPLTPSDLVADQQTYVGIAPTVPPVVIGNSIIYVQARGSIVRDLAFDQEVEGLAGRDLTVFANHLFDGHTLRAITYQQTPDSIVWCVREDGMLLGLTYLKEQDVWGWHRHDTQLGAFWDVAAVAEPGEDALYVVVYRYFDGVTPTGCIERLDARTVLNFDADSFFVDSGLSYAGAPVSTVGGLDHLEGQRVAVLADGVVLSDGSSNTFVVSGGQVVLGAAYSNVHVGLPIVSEIEPLPLDVAGSDVRARVKRVPGVRLIVDSSSRSFSAGPDADHLQRFSLAEYDTTERAFTGSLEISIPAKWRHDSELLIRQTDPLPLTILGIVPLVEVGG